MTYEGFWSILLGVGTAQGVLLTGILFSVNNARGVATKILASLVMILSLHLLEEFFEVSNIVDTYPHLLGMGFALDLLIGPLTLFYALFSTKARESFLPKDFLHVIPFIAAILFFLPFYTLTGAEKLTYFNDGIPIEVGILVSVKTISFLIYSYFTMQILNRWSNTGEDQEAKNTALNINYFRKSYPFIVASVMVIYATFFMMYAGLEVPIASDKISSIILAIFIYLLAFYVIRYPYVFSYGQVIKSNENRASLKKKKYSTSSLTEEEKAIYAKLMVERMSEKELFKNQELMLRDLSEEIGVSDNKMSQILNEAMGKSFYEWVNSYRVTEFKRRMASTDAQSENLLTIAFECGFNNKASFNRIFKQFEGTTPSKYKESLKKSNN